MDEDIYLKSQDRSRKCGACATMPNPRRKLCNCNGTKQDEDTFEKWRKVKIESAGVHVEQFLIRGERVKTAASSNLLQCKEILTAGSISLFICRRNIFRFT